MTAGKFDITAEAGATLRLTFTFSADTGDVDEEGQPIYEPQDFTDADLRLQVRPEPGGAVLADLSTVDGGITVDGGTVTVELTADQTAALARGRYDLLATYATGDARRLLEGAVLVRDRITEGSV